MKTSTWMKKFAAIAVSALMGLMLVTVSRAAVENVVAQVTFANPFTITEVNSLQYGTLDHNLNTETIIIGTDSSVSGTGTAFVIGVAPAAANLTVAGDASQAITILVDSIVSGTGYSLGTFICKYGTGSDTACDGAGYPETSVASATLLIGATLTGDNLAVPGAANGSFDVTVTYQ